MPTYVSKQLVWELKPEIVVIFWIYFLFTHVDCRVNIQQIILEKNQGNKIENEPNFLTYEDERE
jgi:hypothetical protein